MPDTEQLTSILIGAATQCAPIDPRQLFQPEDQPLLRVADAVPPFPFNGQ